MRPGFQTLLKQKKIQRTKGTTRLIIEELDISTRDLGAAQQSRMSGDNKSATIEAYHSMLHASRALLYRMGYSAQSHDGLVVALRQLYEAEIVDKMLTDFAEATTLYENTHNKIAGSERSITRIMEDATDFLE